MTVVQSDPKSEKLVLPSFRKPAHLADEPTESPAGELPQQCLAVIIPVFNEMETAEPALRAVLRQEPVQEVIVVDDASRDGTGQRLAACASGDARLRVLTHERNLGKGAAIRTALQHVTAPVVVIQDADLEYDPADYAAMLEAIRNGEADVVYGSRFLNGERNTARVHRAINWGLTALSNWVNGLALTDAHTGLKMFRTALLKSIVLEEDRFGFCPEVTAKIAKLRTPKIVEVAVSYRPRNRAAGKKIGVWDGFRALYCIAKYGMSGRL